ncbi:class I SAM-dependent methyltransferase [Lacticaseibacillus sharpeae]|uniref:16S RNA methylase n=1 Tax=Lacticaseibacillus sharpeae JCM 1186 = DSM 20505 TaxID=1291052 RepID=A0A0R1ZNX2_9LACO|nr:class I SAM-dependent methyltransferase [Lacticaseibacillus sharpeae]KRM56154.1 16S RNA methylase [Lacticaseibacillus sharpeae JCM 1186 = DSM 20505]
MNHYYTNDPDLEHNEHSFNFDLGGHSLHFTTDNGVFSKHTIDFGSRVLIETVLNQENLPAGDILDVGCGYGPIGIALAKTLGRNVTMSDVNERAMALAKRNAEANGVTAQTTIIESSAYANITGEFGFIVTNPPVRAGKAVVSAIISGAFDHLVAGGEVFVVLQKKQGAPSAKKLLDATFGNADVLKKDAGYYILHAVK